MSGCSTILGVHIRALLALVIVAALAGCNRGGDAPPAASIEAAESSTATEPAVVSVSNSIAEKPVAKKPRVDPIVVVRTSAGDIKLQLFIEKAPQTVDNFLRNYVRRGFYKGTIVHYVDSSSMLLAGGYTADLQPKETRAPIYNEAANGLSNTRGTLAMARDPQSAHSATSQWFINLADNTHFDHQDAETEGLFGYCVFGQVIEGLDVVDRIAQTPVAQQGDFPNVPTQTIVIEGVTELR